MKTAKEQMDEVAKAMNYTDAQRKNIIEGSAIVTENIDQRSKKINPVDEQFEQRGKTDSEWACQMQRLQWTFYSNGPDKTQMFG